MHINDVINRIRRLNIPQRAKEQLFLLYSRARKLVSGILRFLERHRRFGESVLLGALVAYLLSRIPWIGGFLALCALVTSAALGLLRELREDIDSLFAATPSPA